MKKSKLFLNVGLAIVLAVSLFLGAQTFRLAPVQAAEASSEQYTYSVQNITKNQTVKIDFLNDSKDKLYTFADKVVALESSICGDFVEVPYGSNGQYRYIVEVKPDAADNNKLKVSRVGKGEELWRYNDEKILGVDIPAGGYILVGCGKSEESLKADFAVGDEVSAIDNKAKLKLVNRTRKGEINITSRNVHNPDGSAAVYTDEYTNTIAQEIANYRLYITAEWNEEKQGYVVSYTSGMIHQWITEKLEALTVPENGIVIEAYGDVAAYNSTTAFLTKVGDVLDFTDAVPELAPCDVKVKVGTKTFVMDGKNPTETSVNTKEKSVIYTNDCGYVFSFPRKDADFAEYLVEVKNGTHTITDKKTTATNVIPYNGYVLSIPSTVAGYDALNIGDQVEVSGADSTFVSHTLAVDNITKNTRVFADCKNAVQMGNQLIIYNDMPGNKTFAGWNTEVIVDYDAENGKYVVKTAPTNLWNVAKSEIPEKGFVISGNGNSVTKVSSFAIGDEVALRDGETSVTPTGIEVSVENTKIVLDGINPGKYTDTNGKTVIYTSDKLHTENRNDATVIEIAVNITEEGHIIDAVYNKSNNPIPNYGYVISVPNTAAGFDAIEAAFVKGAKVNFVDNGLVKTGFMMGSIDNITQDYRVGIRGENTDYIELQLKGPILFNDREFISSKEGSVKGNTPVFEWSYDVVVEKNQEGKYLVTKVHQGGGIAIPENGFVINSNDVAGLALSNFAVGDEVKLNNYTADNDVTLKDITVDGVTIADFNKEQNNYFIKYEKTVTTVPEVAFVKGQEGQEVKVVKAEKMPGKTVISVKSLNGRKTAEYVINFQYELDTNSELSGIKVGDKVVEGFNKDQTTYTVYLDYGTKTYPVVTATAANEFATVSVKPADNNNKSAVITVKAEDTNYVTTYTINFVIVDTTLSAIKVGGKELDGFDKDVQNYVVEIEEGASVPVVAGIANDSKATVTVVQAGGDVDTAVITVKGANGNYTRTYEIKFRLAGTSTESVKSAGCGSNVEADFMIIGIVMMAAVIIIMSRKLHGNKN